MTSQKRRIHRPRITDEPNGETYLPQGAQESPPHHRDEEDILLLLAERSQTRRKPDRYLNDWLRRFARG